MDHNLESLGPERFQQLCQALLAKEYEGVTCFPVAQPDGGRDAYRMVVDPRSTRAIVYQIKYSRKPLSEEEGREWVLAAVKTEEGKADALAQRGATEYMLITNVPGTAHLDTGSIDRLRAELTPRFGMPVVCWWRDDINRRLDGNWDIKLRYPEVLSGQDFLRLLLDSASGQEQERRRQAMMAFMADQYEDDAEVKFKQVELQNRLLDLFVDLPFSLALPAIREDIHDLRASMPVPVRVVAGERSEIYITDDPESDCAGTASLLLSELKGNRLRQVVVEGAPGQGKSTLAQYLCQVHRIRWLLKATELTQLPKQHAQAELLLPIKVDLRDLATWISGNDPFDLVASTSSMSAEVRTLEVFLAHLIQHKSGGIRFDVVDLIEVSKRAPLLVVLDGLDEVADLKGRGDVVTAVSKAVNRLRENCPTFRVVVTSRPAAFANSPGFDRQLFPHIDLGSVRRTQIQQYAKNGWMPEILAAANVLSSSQY